MRKFVAYLLLVIFGVFILFGSLMIQAIPQSIVTDEAGRTHLFTVYDVAFGTFALLVAYLGMFLIIQGNPRGYLATKYGYGKVVRLGFVLHMVTGFLFLFSVYGGTPGTIVMNLIVSLLLFGPLPARKIWLKQQRDNQYDNFLEESPDNG